MNEVRALFIGKMSLLKTELKTGFKTGLKSGLRPKLIRTYVFFRLGGDQLNFGLRLFLDLGLSKRQPHPM